MTQEEKQLLLKDLCARLPYKVVVTDGVEDYLLTSPFLYRYIEMGCRPYLRPMSSMTEEEKTEYFDMHVTGIDSWYIVDWLNKRYLDYHYFISKGLALEAPEDMYKTE